VVYDRQYRRVALALKDLNWSVPNVRLYNEAFTGRARAGPRMPLDVHSSLKDVQRSLKDVQSSLKDVHSSLKDVQSFLKDVHSRIFMAWDRARAMATATVTTRFNFGHPLRTRDVRWRP